MVTSSACDMPKLRPENWGGSHHKSPCPIEMEQSKQTPSHNAVTRVEMRLSSLPWTSLEPKTVSSWAYRLRLMPQISRFLYRYVSDSASYISVNADKTIDGGGELRTNVLVDLGLRLTTSRLRRRSRKSGSFHASKLKQQ